MEFIKKAIPAALASPQGAPQVTPARIKVECHR
jgi:hypothetical protein